MSKNTTTFEREGMIPNQSLLKVSASSSEEMSGLFEKLNQCQMKPVVLFSAKSGGPRTIGVRILGKEPQVSEMLVPDRKRGLLSSISSSAGHNMTTY